MALERGYRWVSFKGAIDVDIDVEVNIDRHFGCLKRVLTSVQVLLNGRKAVLVLILTFLK